MAEYTLDPHGSGTGSPAGSFVNVAAAAVSIALIGGVGVWGYDLLMRDVTGVPVVRAMQGEMRVAPETPGGEIASHVGLSVNSVPALGGAAEPEDRLILAPSNNSLQAADMDVAPMAEGGEVMPSAPDIADDTMSSTALTPNDAAAGDQPAALSMPVDPSTPLTADDVLALADQIAAGETTPLTNQADGTDGPADVTVNGVAANPDIIPDAVPGVRRALRPVSRPAVRAPVAASSSPSTIIPVTGAVSTATIPAGTKLVQLGAFDSVDIAATEWVRMTVQFPDFFDGKQQVIQQANSGGRTFYRLRAMGFVDLSDARRFCAAMSAEGAACIPVVVR